MLGVEARQRIERRFESAPQASERRDLLLGEIVLEQLDLRLQHAAS